MNASMGAPVNPPADTHRAPPDPHRGPPDPRADTHSTPAGTPHPGVHRDAWGIPHLWADSVDELAFLQGRVTALDRAWQIEVERWRCEGHAAAHLGPEHLEWDRLSRRVGLERAARRCFERLGPRDRRWVTAYVDGVNDGLRAGADGAPEFEAAGCRPGHWQPWSPLGVFLVQHVLFGSFPHKLWRARAEAALGPGGADLFGIEGPHGSGSNAWAVTGRHTASGLPLVAGDPHRIVEFPGIYQQVHLACPEFDVVGLAFPGVPGLPHFAHTGHVAWGVTHAMADHQDLYRERLRRVDGRVLALGPDGWAPAVTWREHVEVRGGAPETVEVVVTARGPVVLDSHGPVVLDSHESAVLASHATGVPGSHATGVPDDRGGEALSLRSPALVEGDLGFSCLLPLLRARSVDDVERGLRAWVEPVNSVLVADTAGRVRQLVAGRVPRRDARCHEGPVPAWDATYGWTGHHEVTRGTDVPDLAVTANDRRPDVAHLGTEFAPPHRARRITALLRGRGDLTAADMAAVHRDTLLGSAPALTALLEEAVLDAPRDGSDVTDAARRLHASIGAWDGHMRADSEGAAAFAAWRAALVRELAAHPFLWPVTVAPDHGALFRPWTDALARVGHGLETLVAALPDRGVDVRAAARAALAASAADLGDGPRVWGQDHVLRAVRTLPDGVDAPAPLPDDVGPLDPLAEDVGPLSGDTDCVLSTTSTPGVTHACSRGPVARYVWDLSGRSRGGWVVPHGASGHPRDPHAHDQHAAWVAGELVPVVSDWNLLVPDGSPLVPDGSPHPPAESPPIHDAADTTGRPVAYEEHVPGVGHLTLVTVRPDSDAALLHAWVSRERARFWGMTALSVEEVREVYAFIDAQPTEHAHLVRVDGVPVGLFQSYDPAHAPVGEHYAVEPGDVGMHLLLAARPPTGDVTDGSTRDTGGAARATDVTRALGVALVRFLLSAPGRARVVVEPDARNALALRRLRRSGFVFGPEVDLPHKRARLAWLTREAFERDHGVLPGR